MDQPKLVWAVRQANSTEGMEEVLKSLTEDEYSIQQIQPWGENSFIVVAAKLEYPLPTENESLGPVDRNVN